MSRGPDAGTALIRAMEASAERAGCPIRVVASGATRWASATFAGARHELRLEAAEVEALGPWLAELPEVDLPTRGYLVADIQVQSVHRASGVATIEIEALTVEA
jgi:hypothetical protein